MYKKIIIMLLMLILGLVMFFVLRGKIAREQIALIKEESYFSDFHIKDGKVYVECCVTIENVSNTNKNVTFTAIMNEDYKCGLLKQKRLNVLDVENNEIVFQIHANSKDTYELTFVGEHGNNSQKANRLLPPIDIKILD